MSSGVVCDSGIAIPSTDSRFGGGKSFEEGELSRCLADEGRIRLVSGLTDRHKVWRLFPFLIIFGSHSNKKKEGLA
ncbi:MAG TPA: hypothetical protein DGH68_09125 [Bacteroidetes bacterium]|nr:hypothetical protein [Bacteroidota bacterium]